MRQDYFIEHFFILINSGKAKENLQKVLDEDKKLRRKQKMFEKKFKIDSRQKILLSLLRKILLDKARRMDSLYFGYSAFELFLREIAGRLDLSINQVYMIYLGDLSNVLRKGKADAQLINDSSGYSCYVKQEDKLNFYVGKEATKRMKLILSALPSTKEVNEIKGEIAFPGKVRGIVRLIKTKDDNFKMKVGEILLAHETNPSLLPAMNVAKAFISDMGGLTCHTAIVAREMKKPCIIGTKIATQLLRDGDMVEVDAERGIIRKL